MTQVSAAAANLPETVLRLTYGDKWEDAREHFLLLGQAVAFMAEAAAWINDVAPEFKPIRKAFRQLYPGPLPAPSTDDPAWIKRAHVWADHPRGRAALFHQRKAAEGLLVLLEVARKSPEKLYAIEPWLYAYLTVNEDIALRRRAYDILAATATSSSKEFLYGELERAGRHPLAGAILRAMAQLKDNADRNRTLALYDKITDDGELMPPYLKLLHPFTGQDVWQVIIRALNDHAHQAAPLLDALRATGHPEPESIIRERFDREENYFLLDLLAELIAEAREGIRVTLEDMNARIDDPLFTDTAQVTWPQMLEPNWKALVRTAPTTELMPIIGNYLHRKEGRLQRNALLQLRYFLRQHGPVALSPDFELRLTELIGSRYDKVSTVALNVLTKVLPYAHQPEMIVDAVLENSLTTQYRLMAVAALKAVADRPALKQRQIDFYRSAVGRNGLARMVPYLGFLGIKEELQQTSKKA